MPAKNSTSCKTRSVVLENPETDRFWKNVRVASPSACWEWTGSRSANGRYGQFWYLGAPVGAHRIAYTLTQGAVPSGASVMHRCDNPICCNPDHLSVGSHTDNMRDASRKGRLGVPRPHAQRLTPAQLAEIDGLLAAGMKQIQIAERYGVTRSWVSLYAKGKRRQYDRPEAKAEQAHG